VAPRELLAWLITLGELQDELRFLLALRLKSVRSWATPAERLEGIKFATEEFRALAGGQFADCPRFRSPVPEP
jgi:hypothetical protein